MKKVLSIFAVVTLLSCGGSSEDGVVDSTAVSDTVQVIVTAVVTVDSSSVSVDSVTLGGGTQDGSEVK
jgi:hypothetical protein